MSRSRMLTAAAAFGLILAACGGGDSTDTTTADTTATTTGATTTGATTTEASAPTTTQVDEPTTTQAIDGESAELAAFRAAVAQTSEITTARMEGSFEISGMEGSPISAPVTMAFSGAFDNAAGNFAMSMDLGSMMAAAGDEIPAEFADLFSALEIRQIGDTAYLRFGFINMFLGVETDWVSMPAEDAEGVGDFTGGFVPSNPSDLMSVFGDADGTIEQVGRETLHGVETTHYRFIVDTAKLIAEADADALAELEAQGPIPLDELPMDIWIGDDGLLYRYAMTIDGDQVEAAEGEGFNQMVITFDIWDYGVPVDIAAPDPSDVTDMDDVGGGLFGDFSDDL